MTPGKLQKILQGQTALARKVFEVVPIKEAWPASQIRHSLKEVERSNADLHTVRGCLATLREIGLVREPEPGCFQRHAVRTPQPTPKKEVITMRYWQDLDFEEIAQSLKLSHDNVRKIISRSLAKLRGKKDE